MIYILLYLLIGLVLLVGSTLIAMYIFDIALIKHNKSVNDVPLLNDAIENRNAHAIFLGVINYILWPLSFPFVIRGYYKAYKDIKNHK